MDERALKAGKQAWDPYSRQGGQGKGVALMRIYSPFSELFPVRLFRTSRVYIRSYE